MQDVKSIRRLLDEFREGEKEAENLSEALVRLESKIVGVGAQEITDMPRSPSPPKDRISDLLQRKSELEDELQAVIKAQTERRKYIKQVLSQIKFSDERAVIRFRYLLCMSWYEVTNAMFGGKEDYNEREDSYLRRVHKLHGRALVSMANCINPSDQ